MRRPPKSRILKIARASGPVPPRRAPALAELQQPNPWLPGLSPPSGRRTYANTSTCNRESKRPAGSEEEETARIRQLIGQRGGACLVRPPRGGALGDPTEPQWACAGKEGRRGGWDFEAAMVRAEFGTSHSLVLSPLVPLGKQESLAEVLVSAGTHVTRKPGSYEELGGNTTLGSCYGWLTQPPGLEE